MVGPPFRSPGNGEAVCRWKKPIPEKKFKILPKFRVTIGGWRPFLKTNDKVQSIHTKPNCPIAGWGES